MGKTLVKEVICDERWERGEKDARELIKKNTPKTVAGFDKIQRELEGRVDTMYKSEVPRWKRCYKTGSRKKLEKFRETLVKK
jgi:hypothetical protein